jgi:hypothetical protein
MYARVAVDTVSGAALELTNVWNLQLSQDRPLYLNDGSYIYTGSNGRIVMSPQVQDQRSTVELDMLPRIGSFPLFPAGHIFSLYIAGIEYPGCFGTPPTDVDLLIDQPYAPRAGAPYTVEATFSAPALRSMGRLQMVFAMDALPVRAFGATCTVEDVPAPFIDAAIYSIAVPLPMALTQEAFEGVRPVGMPHVTVRCTMQMNSQEAIASNPNRVFTVSVRDKDAADATRAVIARSQAQMLSPAEEPVHAVVFAFSIARSSLLSAEQLGAALRAVSRPVAESAGVSSKRIALQDQEVVFSDNGNDVLTLSFHIMPANGELVGIDVVKAAMPAASKALRHLGYELKADDVRIEALDAECVSGCSSGCSICFDGDTCTWDIDCVLDGVCASGTCVHEKHEPSRVWLVVLLSGLAALGVAAACVVVWRRLMLRRRSENDMHDLLINDEVEYI